MTDFNAILEEVEPDFAYTPYASKDLEGKWREGFMSISFLNEHFGQYETAEEMKNATTSEGLKLFFDWLVEQGKLPA